MSARSIDQSESSGRISLEISRGDGITTDSYQTDINESLKNDITARTSTLGKQVSPSATAWQMSPVVVSGTVAKARHKLLKAK